MNKLTDDVMDFKSFEKNVFILMCKIACELIQKYLELWDLVIMARRDKDEYFIINLRTTTIKTIMGEVIFKRRYYKKKSGGYTFLLDEAIGLEKGCGLVSENLTELIVVECSEKPFRKAADSISSLTGQSISAMGAWGVFNRFGERLEKQEDRLYELDRNDIVGQLGEIPCKVLFGEYDDVWLSMQKEKRQKNGNADNTEQKKPGMKPMHVATAYTGWEQENENRYRTVDKVAYASYENTSEFISKFEMLLRQRFDMDGVECRIINGDGAHWIKTAAETDGVEAILQLDPYHRSQAIFKAISNKSDRKILFDLLKENNVEGVLLTIAELAAITSDEDQRKKILGLFDYFHSNKNNLLTWQERGEVLPAPPDGIFYRSLGVQETSNCSLITLRMKHRKGSWSVAGANNMARILCYRNTIGIDVIMGTLPESSPVMDFELPLSAAKAPLYDGTGYDGGWLYADMPFDQAFKTNGRDAIKNMLRQRPLAELHFI